MQFIVHLADLYNENFLVVGVSLLSLTFISFLFLWNYNRKKFQELKHQLPASVLHGYLDSIIQNSHSLKSSLFRGDSMTGGALPPLTVGQFTSPGLVGGAVPPSHSTAFVGSAGIGGSGHVGIGEDASQKNAEISSLKAQLQEKQGMIADLEEKITGTLVKLRASEEKCTQLESDMHKVQSEAMQASKTKAAPAATADGEQPPTVNVTISNELAKPAAPQDDSVLKVQLDEVTKERDLLKEKLREYEFIENDLAEIPRLQRTVEILKRTLVEMGVNPDEKLGAAGVASASSSATAAAATPETSTEQRTAGNEDILADVLKEPADGAKSEEQKKGPDDDLLQQFEKMLG